METTVTTTAQDQKNVIDLLKKFVENVKYKYDFDFFMVDAPILISKVTMESLSVEPYSILFRELARNQEREQIEVVERVIGKFLSKSIHMAFNENSYLFSNIFSISKEEFNDIVSILREYDRTRV